jgi:hypothetical protein
MRSLLCRVALLGILVPAIGCDEADSAPVAAAEPDARLRTHEIQPSTPTAEGLAYVESIAAAHRQADGLEGRARTEALRAVLAVPVPGDLPEAEVLRLELATRLAELSMEQPSGAAVARDLLQPMLSVERSLPLDRSTARALVVLGDAAAKTGDDALAAGSYARSIRMLSILRQELER